MRGWLFSSCPRIERFGSRYRIASILAERFRQGDFTGGIEAGIEAVSEGLAGHFPYLDSGTNDLGYEDDQGKGR
jgi:hypothetical protein